MGRFTKQVEDHGAALAQELEDFISHIAQRAQARAEVVKARLAALEHEQKHLDELDKKLNG